MKRILNILLILLFSLTATAQRKDGTLYTRLDEGGLKIYYKARANRTNKRCLELANELFEYEKKRGDKYGQCCALCLPVQYWHLKRNDAEYAKAIQDLRQLSKASNCTALYYYSYYEEVEYFLDTKRSMKALHVVNELTKELKTAPTDHGKYMVNVALGNIYLARRDELHAKQYFLEAVKMAEKLQNTSDLPIVYLKMAQITEDNDIASREKYLNLSLHYSINPIDSAASLMGLAYLQACSNDKQKFWENYDKYVPMLHKENLSQVKYEKWYKYNEAYRLTIQGKPDSAAIVRQSIANPYLRYQAHEDYYRSHGDLKLTNAYLDSIVAYLHSSQAEQNVSDVTEMSVIYETEKFKSDAEQMRQDFIRQNLIVVIIFLVIILIVLIIWLDRHRRDMKKMKKLSDELRKTSEEAVQASKMKDVFIQNMSHEIRTPLNAVVGFAQLMSLPDDCYAPGEKEGFVEHIHNNANLLTMLIDDILNVSDVESGNYRMEMGDVSVNEICRTAMATVQTRVPENIEMLFESDIENCYNIHTDARRAQQVLINFLTNSIKHTTEGHILLKVSTTEKPGMVTFSVADTGTGVPEEKAEFIFQRFEKLNAFVQGTGLGLNICRIIADKLQGECYLDTSYPSAFEGVSHGARFIFALPR